MADGKGYTDNDKLKADDEISPEPARDDQAAGGSRKDFDDASPEAPRPATSE